MTIKTGWKTTEFWLSLATVIAGAVMASGLPADSVAVRIAGMATSVLTVLGYTATRVALKGAALDSASGE